MTQAMAPLRIARFRALWLASIFSSVGTFLQAVTGSWLMLELTGSAAWVGWMVASNTLPLLFLSLAAGALADMFDRRKLLIITQSTMGSAAGGMALLTWLDQVTPTRLLALGLLLGVGTSFNLPAWQSMIPDLVPRGMVASAIALNSVAFNVARSVGPALGGLLIATVGPESGFALNTLSYLGVISVLVVMFRQVEPAAADQTSMVNAISVGLRFGRYTPTFRRLLGLVALFALTSAVVQSVLPSRTEQLGGQAGTYGLLLGALGAGALLGGLTRGPITERLARWSLPFTVAWVGLFGIALGLAPNLGLALFFLPLIGLGWVWTLSTLSATAQLLAPPWVRGRAMSLYSLSLAGVMPLGSILAGTLADRVGAGEAMVILASATLGLGLIAPRFRIPALSEVSVPEFEHRTTLPEHVETQAGGPVMIVNTWLLEEHELEEFLDLMQEVRLVRLSTGSHRWRLYRAATDPHRLTEVFLTVSWEEHLSQHRRIDDASSALLLRLRDFGVKPPVTRHLIAVDMEHPENWSALFEEHASSHAQDGSLPLPTTRSME